MMSKKASREHVVSRIKELRSAAEAEVKKLIDAHMAEHHPKASDYGAHAERCSIEVDTWSERQKRSTYSQQTLES